MAPSSCVPRPLRFWGWSRVCVGLLAALRFACRSVIRLEAALARRRSAQQTPAALARCHVYCPGCAHHHLRAQLLHSRPHVGLPACCCCRRSVACCPAGLGTQTLYTTRVCVVSVLGLRPPDLRPRLHWQWPAPPRHRSAHMHGPPALPLAGGVGELLPEEPSGPRKRKHPIQFRF